MSVTLGHNQYGKAETRVVRVYRDSDPHEIVDYNVSVALSGDFDDIHLTGDNAKLPDHRRHQEHRERLRQGARRGRPPARVVRHRAGQALRGRHRAGAPGPDQARDVPVGPAVATTAPPHPHAFARDGGHVRTATVTYDGSRPG